jgi:putative phage-type endonuclease
MNQNEINCQGIEKNQQDIHENDESEIDNVSISSESTEKTSFIARLTEYELSEMESTVEDLLHHYLETHLAKWSDPDFMHAMIHEVTQLLLQDLVIADICKETDEEELAEYVDECADNVCMLLDLVPRDESHILPDILSDSEKADIRRKLQWIREQPQPQQRTPEWYTFRHGLISASNIWKAFSTECQQNSLIYEKCQPISYMGGGFSTNTTSPLHWGVKYEPLTLMLYKEKMGAQHGGELATEEFGCIRHAEHDFIGASPDGIVTDESSPLYGRMVEIKNVVNRVIDGVPSMAYWVQMQMQMETCNLDACDFVETQIKEYASADEFWGDADRKRGIVVMFADGDGQTIYRFMPLNIELTRESCDKWLQNIIAECATLQYVWRETQYWYLDIFSCVTVRRNSAWFHAALPEIRKLWGTVLLERESGHHHRAPKKRNAKQGSILQNYIVNKLESDMNINININIDGDGDKHEDVDIIDVIE